MEYNRCPKCGSLAIRDIESPRKRNLNVVLMRLKCNECLVIWDSVFEFYGIEGLTKPPRNFLYKVERMRTNNVRVYIEVFINDELGTEPKLAITCEHDPFHGYPIIERVVKLIGDHYGYATDADKIMEPRVTLFQIGRYEDEEL